MLQSTKREGKPMTVPDQAINELGKDAMDFRDVQIQIAYQLMTSKRKSPPRKGLACNTHISKAEVKEKKKRKRVLVPKKLKSNIAQCPRPIKAY